MAMLPELVYDELPAGVESFYLSDYLANTLADNAVVNTTSFTPFRGAVCHTARSGINRPIALRWGTRPLTEFAPFLCRVTVDPSV